MTKKVLSCFCGAGGFSLGFSKAGLKPFLGIDINSDACKSYSRNLNVDVLNSDISFIDS